MTAVGREISRSKKGKETTKHCKNPSLKIQIVPNGNWNSNPKNMICKERLVEKKLSVCIVLYCISYSQERSKCHEKGRKTRIVSSIVIFERPPAMKLSLGMYQVLNKSQGMLFSLHNRPWNLLNGSVYAVNTETPITSAMICSKVGP